MTMHHAAMQFKSVSDADRSVHCVASTDAIDSYGDIVDPKSWRLERYLSNPVVLFSHDSKAPIGRASDVRVEGNALQARLHFATTERASEVFSLVQQQILRGVSVGFVPGRIATERRGADDVTVLYDNTLVELSVVAVPANAQALIKAKSMGLVSDDIITREYVEALLALPAEQRVSRSDEALLERWERGERFPSAAEIGRIASTTHISPIDLRPQIDRNGAALARKAFGDDAVVTHDDLSERQHAAMLARQGLTLADLPPPRMTALERRKRDNEAMSGGEALAKKIFGG